MSARWTAADREALLEAVRDEGATSAEAAGELGRSVRAVERMRARLGAKSGVAPGRPGPAPCPYRRARVLALLAAGASLSAIARVLGVIQPTVQGLVRGLVRDGLVRREGGRSTACRYVPVAWGGEKSVRLNAGRKCS